MITELTETLAVQSRLAENVCALTFRDRNGWQFSVTACCGMVLPTRIFLSRMFIVLMGADGDMRDWEENLNEVLALNRSIKFTVYADLYEIDYKIEKYFRTLEPTNEKTLAAFRVVVASVLDILEESERDAVEVDSIPLIFRKTLPDRVTPQQIGPSACAHDVFLA